MCVRVQTFLTHFADVFMILKKTLPPPFKSLPRVDKKICANNTSVWANSSSFSYVINLQTDMIRVEESFAIQFRTMMHGSKS